MGLDSRSIACPRRAQPLGSDRLRGAVAQLGERLNGIQEVDGSIPFGSTTSTLLVVTIDRRLAAYARTAPRRRGGRLPGAIPPKMTPNER